MTRTQRKVLRCAGIAALGVFAFTGVISVGAEETQTPADPQAHPEKHIYVSPTGHDANPGTREKPLKDLHKAVAQGRAGMTIHVLPPERHVYVSPSGDDTNPGTHEKPLKDLRSAVARARPGTIIHLLPGVYPPVHLEGITGTEQSPIVIRGEAAPPLDFSSLERLSHENLDVVAIRKALNEGDFSLAPTKGFSVIDAQNQKHGLSMRGCTGLLIENLVIQNAGVNLHVSESHYIIVRNCVLRETRKDPQGSSEGMFLSRMSASSALKEGRDRADKVSSVVTIERVVAYDHFGHGFWVDEEAALDVNWIKCVSHNNGRGQKKLARRVKLCAGFSFAWVQRNYPRHHFVRCAAINNWGDGFNLGSGIGGMVFEYCVADGNARKGTDFYNLRVVGGVLEGHIFRSCVITGNLFFGGGSHVLEGVRIPRPESNRTQ